MLKRIYQRTKEHKRKMSVIMKQCWQNEKYREARRKNPTRYWLDKCRSEETKKKIGQGVRKYLVNEDFFKKWTPKMAWVLGFIVGDGCITWKPGQYELRVAIKDKDVLEKIKRAMGSKHPIKKIKKKSGFGRKAISIYWLKIGSKEICRDLVALGVVPHKSLTIKFPDVPKKYLSHFLRGVLDSDGSIFCNFGKHKKVSSITAGFYTGSKDFAVGLSERLSDIGFPAHLYPSNTCWRVYCSIKTFLPWLYNDRNYCFMDRKFEKYQSLSAMRGLL